MRLIQKLRNYRNKQSILKIDSRNHVKFPSSIISFSAEYDSNTFLEGENVIESRVNISSSSIGLCTVVGHGNNISNCKIGRFCSIASGLLIQPWTHPTNLVSSYPGFFATINNYPFGKGNTKFQECIHCDSGFYIEIGNDVWIGEHVIIKGGVRIGDGAVIGMGAVVTKDIPPYSIACGVPAKVVKKRFDDATIECLLNIKWWNWDLNDIKKRREDFSDIKSFVLKYGNK